MADHAIKVDKVSKSFRLPRERHTSLKQTVLNWRKRRYVNLKALNNISFEVKKGEFFGIVGRNGSGKSTLLKLIAGIYQPTSGGIHVNGRLTPFIELGVGFNPELTGRENVFLNGTILGLTQKEIASKYDEIVAFAELEKFMDQKLKNYSSGMQVRLAFAIAIQAHNDILLIDEVLAVGDASFQKKCVNYFRETSGKRTMVLVSHDMNLIREYCNRGIVLHNGKTVAKGQPGRMVAKYVELNLPQVNEPAGLQQKTAKYEREVSFKDVHTHDSRGKKQKLFRAGEPIGISVRILAEEPLKAANVGLSMIDEYGNVVLATDSTVNNKTLKNLKANSEHEVNFIIDNVYTNGIYRISTAVNDLAGNAYARFDFAEDIRIIGWKFPHSMVHPKQSVSISLKK